MREFMADQIARAIKEPEAVIEELKAGVRYLREKTDFTESLFKSITGFAVIAANFDGDIIAYNTGAEHILGYPAERIVTESITVDIFFPKDFIEGGGLQDIINHVMSKELFIYEGEMVRQNGDKFPAKVILSLVKNNEGKMVGFVEIVEDLTERNRWEEEIKKLNAELEEKVMDRTAHLSAITENAGDAIVSLKAPDIVYLWNKKAEEMFGYSAEEIVGRELHELIVPERYREKSREGLKSFFETGTGPVVGKTVEIEGLRKDGTEFPIELTVSAMKIRGEWQSTGIVRDITERRKAEDKLKERLDELERFRKATIQREFRVKELRDRVAELEGKKDIQDSKFKIQD